MRVVEGVLSKSPQNGFEVVVFRRKVSRKVTDVDVQKRTICVILLIIAVEKPVLKGKKAVIYVTVVMLLHFSLSVLPVKVFD